MPTTRQDRNYPLGRSALDLEIGDRVLVTNWHLQNEQIRRSEGIGIVQAVDLANERCCVAGDWFHRTRLIFWPAESVIQQRKMDTPTGKYASGIMALATADTESF